MKFFVFITLVVALVACGPETEPPASALNPAVIEPVTRPAEGPSPVEILPPIEARDGPLAVLGTASGLLLFDVDAAAPQPALRLRRSDSRPCDSPQPRPDHPAGARGKRVWEDRLQHLLRRGHERGGSALFRLGPQA